MSKKQFIFLAYGCTSYEADSLLGAFAAEADAKKLIERCAAHDKKRPKSPGVIEDTPENDAEFARWYEKHDKWKKCHPAGGDWNHDSYTVCRIELKAATTPKAGEKEGVS